MMQWFATILSHRAELGVQKLAMRAGEPAAALEVVTNNGMALRWAPESLQDMEGIVLPAVSNNGLALEFASTRLTNTRGVVSAAVRQNGLALQFASYELRQDFDITAEACRQNEDAFEYVLDPPFTEEMLG
eukprot:2098220-Amphidinium_carterae.1